MIRRPSVERRDARNADNQRPCIPYPRAHKLPATPRAQPLSASRLSVVPVSRGDPEENRIKAQEHGLTNVLLQADWEVSEAYDVAGTPGAVLVSPEGAIASPMAGGAESIRAFVAQAVAAPANVPLLPRAPVPRAAQEGQPCSQLRQGPRSPSGVFDTTADTTEDATCGNVGQPPA
jgi:hypothetical protein